MHKSYKYKIYFHKPFRWFWIVFIEGCEPSFSDPHGTSHFLWLANLKAKYAIYKLHKQGYRGDPK